MDDVSIGHGIDVDGMSPEEVFAVLGNETRLNILRALWEASVPVDGGATSDVLSYTDLRRAVAVDDSGQFNYHLSKLTPHFVRDTVGGYGLSHAGERIARSVLTVSDAFADLGFPHELPFDCPFCDSPTIATCDDQQLRIQCTDCPGMFGDQAPAGTIAVLGFPTAGMTNKTLEEFLTANLYKCQLDITYMMHGLCRECGGPVTPSITSCDDHRRANGPLCDTCHSPFEVWVDQRCDRCYYGKRLPVELYVMGLAPVIGFLYDHDIDVLAPRFEDLATCLREWFNTSVSDDPFRIDVSIEPADDALTLTLDEEMTVVDLDGRSPLPP